MDAGERISLRFVSSGMGEWKGLKKRKERERVCEREKTEKEEERKEKTSSFLSYRLK